MYFTPISPPCSLPAEPVRCAPGTNPRSLDGPPLFHRHAYLGHGYGTYHSFHAVSGRAAAACVCLCLPLGVRSFTPPAALPPARASAVGTRRSFDQASARGAPRQLTPAITISSYQARLRDGPGSTFSAVNAGPDATEESASSHHSLPNYATELTHALTWSQRRSAGAGGELRLLFLPEINKSTDSHLFSLSNSISNTTPLLGMNRQMGYSNHANPP
ncbi:hypothetical protein GGS24DRAFT_78586 [Hypoxylon argillaceum]|nr:hypothetical protein GGS24DRAFT_78586 [Hypoxylon argillaceum]